MDPTKPIRISVQNGNVTLYGLVDSQTDKDVAIELTQLRGYLALKMIFRWLEHSSLTSYEVAWRGGKNLESLQVELPVAGHPLRARAGVETDRDGIGLV